MDGILAFEFSQVWWSVSNWKNDDILFFNKGIYFMLFGLTLPF